jgi:thiol-disulfide isomerase/thioredoxin
MRIAALFALVLAVGAAVGIGLRQAGSDDDASSSSGAALRIDASEVSEKLAGAPAALAALHARANDILPGSKERLARELATVEGYPAVVNVWASWCAPCIEEAPIIQRVSLDRAKEVAFLGVNLRDSRSGAARFLKRYPVTFPSVEDPDGDIYNDLRLLGQPATAFYDARGERTFVHQGPYESAAAFDADVRRYALGASS